MGDIIQAAYVFEDPYQDLGSRFPRFFSPDGDLFKGPLLRVVLNTGEDALGEPLPRLLIDFFYAFIKACLVWRDKDRIFWASNRNRVVRIAENYVSDRSEGRHFWLGHERFDLSAIILHCGCCTNDGPCWLCEFSSQSLAFLFRAERLRIQKRQKSALIARNTRLLYEPLIISHIAEYVTGSHNTPGDPIARVARRTLDVIIFVQQSHFAPEIANIISRTQFNTWVQGVVERRLRPFWQARRINRRVPGSLAIWPHAAYLLCAYPVHSLHLSWTTTINIEHRIPPFFTRRDCYRTPSRSAIFDNRVRNSDYWTAADGNSDIAGAPYLGFDDYIFEFSETQNWHSISRRVSGFFVLLFLWQTL